jgi:energy-coupling factor transporter ATP-binding protein EcfA2
MKIVKLESNNIKRLHAVSITPEGTLITVGGKNGAGKSSVLDSIAYAMGGEKLVPSEPIRTGESEAKIVVDLGDLVVTRKFKREVIEKKGDVVLNGVTQPGTWKEFGETSSTLTVTNKDGAKYPSPQAVLDRLLGRLTFDPLAFARDDAKKQADTLRKLVNLDFTILDGQRMNAFQQRAMLKKTYDIKAAQLLTMPFVKDAPSEEISMDAVSDEMRKAEEYRALADDADRQVAKIDTQIANNKHEAENIDKEIKRLDKQIEELQATRSAREKMWIDTQTALKAASADLDAAKITAEAARAVVPDASVIQQKIKNTEIMNNAVRTNQRYLAAQTETEKLHAEIDVQHELVIKAETQKKQALAQAQFPVDGLGLSDDGVLLHNLPFSQAGSAEQVRVSVAIGIALNPDLKVLLIRNGNLLDKNSLALVAEQAEQSGCQIWMEFVSESKDGVAVMMVDGEVA